MKNLFLLIVVGVGITTYAGSLSAQNSGTQSKAPDYIILSMKTPAKTMSQWSITDWEAHDMPQYDFSKKSEYERAVEVGDIDEMSNNLEEYEFINGMLKDGDATYVMDYFNDNMPPFIYVTGYTAEGLPSEYKYNYKEEEKALNEGEIMLDAFETCMDYFKVTYNSEGLPINIKGKTCEGFFSGMEIEKNIIYDKFDIRGNWIQRRIISVDDPDQVYVSIQYREYEY